MLNMKRKLYQNKDEAMVSGIIAGFADYTSVDVTILRIIFVIFVLSTGFFPGVIFYIIAIFIIPNRPTIEPMEKYSYVVYEHATKEGDRR